MTWRPWLAWTLFALTVLLLGANLVLGLTGGEGWLAVAGFLPVTLAFAVVGVLIAVRAGNRLGWLFLDASAVIAVSVAAKSYAARAPGSELPGAAWAGWTLTVLLGIVGTLLFLTPLLFPDGRPPSRRWWPVVWVAVGGGVVEVISSAVSDVNFSSNFPHLRDPVTLTAPLAGLYNLGTGLGPAVFLAGAVSMIFRFRRAGPEVRQQLKWFMYASALAAGIVFVAGDVTANPLPYVEIFVPLIPASVGIAILRYRLYDIDRIISRTLAYAIVTGLLIGVYAGLVLLATEVLSIRSPVVVAVATLVAAALFSPLRRRVQQLVDRRFNRARYDADQTVVAFAARLQDAVSLEAVRADLTGTVTRVLEPAHLSLWVSGGAE